MATFPHFGDQPFNADNLINSSAGIGLFLSKKAVRNVDADNNSFNEVLFTAQHFADSATKLLTDEKYR